MPSAAPSAVVAQTSAASGGRLAALVEAAAPPSAGVAASTCARSPTCGSAIELSVARPSSLEPYGNFAAMFTVS